MIPYGDGVERIARLVDTMNANGLLTPAGLDEDGNGALWYIGEMMEELLESLRTEVFAADEIGKPGQEIVSHLIDRIIGLRRGG